jgi:mRNA-degrading endonuclease RelE of RelBE toxin-antitoxin system
LTYAELRSLQSADPEVIQAIVQQHGWKIADQQRLGDLYIVHWTWEKRGIWRLRRGIWRLVVEYGEGYDTTIIYQTSSARAYAAATDPRDFTTMDCRQQRESENAAYEAYFGEKGQVVIVGTPHGHVRHPVYTVILTTTSNVDAIWFESDYLQ